MKYIVKKNIYTNKIEDCWDSLKQCADEIGVKSPTIKQAIKKHGKCKNYYFGYKELDKKYILELLQNDR